MNIHEYQAKELLAKFGVAVPPGAVAYTAAEAVDAARRLGGPNGAKAWAVKAQIHAGGRGKAGGVRLARSEDEVADGGARFVEGCLFFAIERDLDDALDAAGADHHRHANIEVPDAVLPGQQRGAGEYPLFVEQVGFGHRDRGARRRIKG